MKKKSDVILMMIMTNAANVIYQLNMYLHQNYLKVRCNGCTFYHTGYSQFTTGL